MDIVFRFFILIVVGALIGGITNFFAIKMLFRPLHPVYIGKWRLPFTPGLIPKRHKDIAEKLGQVVVEHLLTADGLTAKLHEEQFVDELNELARKEVSRFLDRDETLLNLTQSLSIERAHEKVEQFILNKLEEKYWHAISRVKTKQIVHIIPREFQDYIDENIPVLIDIVCTKAIAYIESEEGKDKVGHLIDRFLADKGTLGNMVKMFLGNESIMKKVQPEIVKFFSQPTTRILFEEIVRKEWSNIQQKAISDFDEKINYDALLNWLKDQIRKNLNVTQFFNRPLGEILAEQKETILETIVPRLVINIRNFAVSKIETVMEKLRLEDIVKTQVESFPLQRVEEIVLTISSREFKMITYLGALLGGVIGATQGIMFLFL